MKTIGIDMGTTNTKAILFDPLRATVVQKVSAPTPVTEGPWGTVRDAEQLVDLVKSLILDLGKLADLSDVVGLSVSSVGEEVVLLDDKHRPLCPVIPWYDARSWGERDQFFETYGTAVFAGVNPGPWYTLFKLLWWKRHSPQIMRQAHRFTDIGSFILGTLCGRYVMDWSHASRSGAFNLVTKSWSEAVIEAAGLSNAIFPELVPSGANIGSMDDHVAEELGLPSGVLIYAGGHDHFCAAYAGGVRHPGDILVSAGTSEACFVLLDRPIQDVSCRFPAEQGCFVDDELYYLMISIPSGHHFQQWKKLMYGDSDDDVIYREMSRVPPGSEGHRFALADDLTTWTLTGTDRFVNRGVLMRAIHEGLAETSKEIVDVLSALSNQEGQLYVTGKPASKEFWRKLRADVYDREFQIIREVESAALGVAMMASRACEEETSRTGRIG
ncbi:FGGY-family carbohydrate kinase [Alicyclobacillus acidiphilus]|uniref:FGGY-family carbohydrate kinase n=1 Tax=Alicyclobacillus acidiphilus TaxID=182455 RepID=UPI0008334602|nr:FGGY family carbohydrate kinase [Alicyclobacillus acidiphilus]